MTRRSIIALVFITLVLISVGYLVATKLDLSGILPSQASKSSVLFDRLFRTMLGVATVIFLIVEGALLYSVIRFRRRPGDETDAAPVHGNIILEIIWTIIPAVIVAVIGVYSFQVLTEIERPGDQPIVVEVIGRQFFWEFRYPDAGVTAPVLHVPVGEVVHLQITSEDVIHSFWVPDFRVKRDATPGQISELVITPTELGRYPVICAELCGPGHAAMVTDVIVESQEDFEAWLAQRIAIEEGIDEGEPGDRLAVGRSLFLEQGCGGCHKLADIGAAGVVGPPLDDIGTLAEGRIPGLDARRYLIDSILYPDSYVVEGFSPGSMHANYGSRMSDEDLDILIDYLFNQ